MRIHRGFRFELDPNREAVVSLKKHIGAARFAYNWGLARCKEALERGERVPSAFDLSKMWNRWKRENAPWWTEVSKCAPEMAFRDLEQAFRNWRAGRSDSRASSGRSRRMTTKLASGAPFVFSPATSSFPESGRCG